MATHQNVSPPNTLSWQSCFWAIVSIAVNTMLQPSGRILGCPASWNFALRSSPLVCAFSTIDTLVRLIYLIYREKSLKGGLKQIATYRFVEQVDDRENSFGTLRKNWIACVISFVLALLQAVKLYACRGIPWTQIWCTAYIASFMVDELIGAILSGYSSSETSADVVSDKSDENLSSNTLVHQFGENLLLEVSFGAILSMLLNILAIVGFKGLKLPRLTWAVVPTLLWIIQTCFSTPGLHPVAIVISMEFFTIVGRADNAPLIPKQDTEVFMLILLASVYGPGIVAPIMLKVLAPRRSFLISACTGGFLGAHVGAAVVCYGIVYDPSSTYKPWWIEGLG